MRKPADAHTTLPDPTNDEVSSDDDEIHSDDWSSGLEDENTCLPGSASDEISSDGEPRPRSPGDSDAEMPYEAAPRKTRSFWEPEEEQNIKHLPTKLADGRIKKSNSKPTAFSAVALPKEDESEEEDVFDHDAAEREERYRVEDVSTGARFGRPAVADVIANSSRKARIQGAKDQIAGICQEIITDPENNVSRSHS